MSSMLSRIYFNPRTPCGVRPIGLLLHWLHGRFQSTHPVRGATAAHHPATENPSYFNPRTPCGVRPAAGHLDGPAAIDFNPRTPCGVRRPPPPPPAGYRHNFNPRTPCGVRLSPPSTAYRNQSFQSTHPVRGATWPVAVLNVTSKRFQSTHPVRGATWDGWGTLPPSIGFQSTHPVRGATAMPKELELKHNISIHAPRAGCDELERIIKEREAISIHAPRAGCDAADKTLNNKRTVFQSTHPVRGATDTTSVVLCMRGFQSTHPVRGATGGPDRRVLRGKHFNPRTPCGVRLTASGPCRGGK